MQKKLKKDLKNNRPGDILYYLLSGEMAEWPKAQVC